jgi:hypothetical protein
VSADFGTMGGEFRTVYSARTTADLERYLAQHAERLRADFAAVFPTGVVASREVWETIERFDHGP